MAALTALRAKSATLSTTVVDTVSLLQAWDRIEVTNRDAAVAMWVTFNGATPTSGGDDCTYVGPNQSVVVYAPILEGTITAGQYHRVGIIGSANAYTVEGLAGK